MEKLEGTVDLPLCVDWDNRPRQQVNFEHGRPAITHYQCLRVEADRSLVKLKPITGRSHQLRMHMLALDHVIIGDTLYAHPIALAKSDRLCLHAASLAIPHPVTGATLELSCPAPF
jgi:tRNA pseudouridine32 synthase/23S rRNA pseudouridine746 synthase